MPNVVGHLVQDATQLLQAAGVLVPASIGYFGTWPVIVSWTPATPSWIGLDGGNSVPTHGVVTAQSPSSGTIVAVNSAVTLTATEQAMGVVYP